MLMIMFRAQLIFVLSVFLSLWVLPGHAGARRFQGPGVKLSGIYFDGVLKGNPEEPDAAIRLTNSSGKTLRIGGWTLSSRFTPRKRGRSHVKQRIGGGAGSAFKKRTKKSGSEEMRLPEGAKLRPGQSIWIANEGQGFLEVFGFKPDFEAKDTRSDVPNLAGRSFVRTPAKKGTIALMNAAGHVVDFVPYDVNKKVSLLESEMPTDFWKGPPLYLSGVTAGSGWTGRVLARDRDEAGHLLPDTDSAKDWDNGFSKTRLGNDPVHRVEMAGQSHFTSRPMRVQAKVLATSAPDNNFKTMMAALNNAKKTLRVSVYQLTNPRVADAFIRAQSRGVRVQLWLEGAPVGGIPDQERALVDKMHRAGVAVHFLISDSKARIKARYRFDHSKYIIIDDKKVIIGTENYGRTGVPIDNSFGNRGWMIHIENPHFVKQMREVWDHDYRPGKMRDVRSIDFSSSDAYGLPTRKSGFKIDQTVIRGSYFKQKAPRLVKGKVGLELVLSPDTSLNENSAIIGLIARAQKTLFIEQNSVRRKWGTQKDAMHKTPDLPLEAVIAAARRGVKVRVLIDGTWYNVATDDDRNNDDTVALLNEIARKEKLDLRAKVINLETTHLEKIHAKGVIVDDKEVFVGSINWSENSFKGNREVGVVVSHPQIAGYYAELFRRDWAQSRLYTAKLLEDTRLEPQNRQIKGASLHQPKQGSAKGKKLRKGTPVSVVGEMGGKKGAPVYVEMAVGLDETAYLPMSALGAKVATPAESIHLIGREAIIEGRVLSTRVSKKVIQLRMGSDKHPPFMAVIFRSSEGAFREQGIDPVSAFQGRQVRIRGRIESWKTPEVVIRSPEQIELVKAAK